MSTSPKRHLARKLRIRDQGFAEAEAWEEIAEATVGRKAEFFATVARRARPCTNSYWPRLVTSGDGVPFVSVSHRRQCKNRLHTPCASTMAAANRRHLFACIDFIVARHPGAARFKMLTITLKNEPVECTGLMLAHFHQALGRLMRHPRVRLASLGIYASTEIPVRGEVLAPEAGTHGHLLLACTPDSVYLTFDDWRALWREAARLDYDPIVRIEACKDKYGRHDERAAARAGAAEVAKYVTKPVALHVPSFDTTRPTINIEALRHLTLALHRKRLVRYDRIFLEAMKHVRQQSKEFKREA